MIDNDDTTPTSPDPPSPQPQRTDPGAPREPESDMDNESLAALFVEVSGLADQLASTIKPSDIEKVLLKILGTSGHPTGSDSNPVTVPFDPAAAATESAILRSRSMPEHPLEARLSAIQHAIASMRSALAAMAKQTQHKLDVANKAYAEAEKARTDAAAAYTEAIRLRSQAKAYDDAALERAASIVRDAKAAADNILQRAQEAAKQRAGDFAEERPPSDISRNVGQYLFNNNDIDKSLAIALVGNSLDPLSALSRGLRLAAFSNTGYLQMEPSGWARVWDPAEVSTQQANGTYAGCRLQLGGLLEEFLITHAAHWRAATWAAAKLPGKHRRRSGDELTKYRSSDELMRYCAHSNDRPVIFIMVHQPTDCLPSTRVPDLSAQRGGFIGVSPPVLGSCDSSSSSGALALRESEEFTGSH